MRTMRLLFLLLAGFLVAPVWSAPPDAPANLRSTVYSKTVGEIFWDRATDDGIVIGYDITRDGRSLGLHDALSLFEDDLTPNVSHTYEVTAVDNDGERSTTLTTGLNTASVNGGVGVTPDKPQLRYAVYSGTAAEIFWERLNDDSQVIGYDIT